MKIEPRRSRIDFQCRNVMFFSFWTLFLIEKISALWNFFSPSAYPTNYISRFEHQAEQTYVMSLTKLFINHGVKNSYQKTTGKNE